eukprot:GFYU01005383.1.p1 GENE.GFYU01005383.1~~GFYU01005383.1.p1  ORF type:complete len:302 (-),score=111.14 GFYU01005383.1:125-895(-)
MLEGRVSQDDVSSDDASDAAKDDTEIEGDVEMSMDMDDTNNDNNSVDLEEESAQIQDLEADEQMEVENADDATKDATTADDSSPAEAMEIAEAQSPAVASEMITCRRSPRIGEGFVLVTPKKRKQVTPRKINRARHGNNKNTPTRVTRSRAFVKADSSKVTPVVKSPASTTSTPSPKRNKLSSVATARSICQAGTRVAQGRASGCTKRSGYGLVDQWGALCYVYERCRHCHETARPHICDSGPRSGEYEPYLVKRL